MMICLFDRNLKRLIGSYFLISILIGGCTEKKSPQDNLITLSCSEYTWTDVELMVQPYLPDELITAYVMQGQSSEYKVTAAAKHALDMGISYPDSISFLLQKINALNC